MVQHHKCLEFTLSLEGTEQIGPEQKDLGEVYYRDDKLQSSINNFDDSSPFDEAWSGLKHKYKLISTKVWLIRYQQSSIELQE